MARARYKYRVACADGTVWDEFPADKRDAKRIIKDWGDECGCEQPASTHIVQRQLINPEWETVT